MIVIVGLGNPGLRYAHTRHNVGFDVVDIFAKRNNVKISYRQYRSLVGRFRHNNEEIMLVKPQTYMNESGMAVGEIFKRNQLSPDKLLIVYDDMDLPLGKIRIKPSGSSGGHKGMKSIIHHIGTQDFPRIRIGIGKDNNVIDHVLNRFNKKEKAIIQPTIQAAAESIEMILDKGLDLAMNIYNRYGEDH
ncbi:MAG: aminoacyl-tRNA hydrolase [Armatimonadota bacterium]